MARFLQSEGHRATASVVRRSAAAALEGIAQAVLTGRRDGAEFARLLRTGDYDAVVDAAHPFAGELHRALQGAAHQEGVPYLRFERETADLPEDPRLHRVPDAESAARLAAAFGGTIFLTTGVRDAAVYRRAADSAGVRLVARVLPEPESVGALLELGFRPQDVVALRGPFGEELNAALLRHFAARVLVAKESGPRGSQPEKLRAALGLGLEVVLVRRPEAPSAATARTAAELRGLLAGCGAPYEEIFGPRQESAERAANASRTSGAPAPGGE